MLSRKRSMAAPVAKAYDSVKFDDSTYEEDRSGGYFVSFTNGQLMDDEGLEFGLYEDKASEHAPFKKRHLVAESEDITYIGHNTGKLAPSHDYRYVVGIFDRKKNVCKLYNSETFVLSPNLEVVGDEESEEEEQTKRQKSDALTSAFGASRKRKTMEARRQNAITGDTLVGTMQTIAANQPAEEQEAQTPLKNSIDDIIPKYNLDATSPDDAYPLENIITNEMVAAFNDQEDVIGTEENPLESEFLSHHLEALPQSKDKRAKRYGIICYMYHLMRLYKMTYKELRASKDPLPASMPAVVKRQIMNDFIVQVGKNLTIPSRQKDSILAHMLVLALRLEGYKMTIEKLMSDLKLPPGKITKHLTILGCAVARSGRQRTITVEFKVPFKIGDVAVGPPRRKSSAF